MALSAVVGQWFYCFDAGQLRLFGVAMPFGVIAGIGIYVSIAAFLHGDDAPDRAELPRQMLIIAMLAAIVAHYLEIHFAIAIGATRTHFWVLLATMMVIGMRLAEPRAGRDAERSTAATAEACRPCLPPDGAGAGHHAGGNTGKSGKGKGKGQPLPQPSPSAATARARQQGRALPCRRP